MRTAPGGRRWRSLLAALALVAGPARAFAEPVAAASVEPAREVASDAGAADSPRAFGPGEHTTYDVSFLGVHAGTAEVTVGWSTPLLGRDVWPLVCVGRTAAAAELAYPIADRFVSYWDPVAARALAAELFADENRARRRERYVFDAARGEVASSRQRQGASATERRFAAPPDTIDLAGAAFQLRSRTLAVGEVLSLPVFLGSRVSSVEARVEALETLETTLGTTLGTTDVYRVALTTRFAGSFATRSRMRAYLTADAKKLPVRLEADFLLGAIVIAVRSHVPQLPPR